MTYVFRIADTGIPAENRKGCWPALIFFAVSGFVLVGWVLVKAEGILVIFALAVTYLLPSIVLVILLIGAVVVLTSALKSKLGIDEYPVMEKDSRYLVVDENGITDRFRNASTRIAWADVATVELDLSTITIQKHVGYPGKYRFAHTAVDTAEFAAFCRAQIAASQRA